MKFGLVDSTLLLSSADNQKEKAWLQTNEIKFRITTFQNNVIFVQLRNLAARSG